MHFHFDANALSLTALVVISSSPLLSYHLLILCHLNRHQFFIYYQIGLELHLTAN